VPPRRLLNAKRRSREYLTVKEVGKLVEDARSRGRYGHRDATMILVAHRHGLRASELCALRWDQVDLERGLVHVRRLKN
jgi:type 1 fimbriae regulatory protein FimB/type 1 fimbriae regulatory protein FimE